MAGRPVNYATTQIVLHWSVAALVLFQFVAHGPMEAAWRAMAQSATVEDYTLRFANLHAVTGALIFCLAVWRVALRLTRGVPPLPAEEPAPLRLLANATHFLIYALLLLMPLSGSAAWLGGVEAAAGAHSVASTALLILVVIHVAGALLQHFWLRTDVLTRMLSSGK